MELQKPKKGTRGRPISFDKGQLVNAVMQKFWQQGYNQVSLNEIAKDNGLTRASLYHSFNSKEALFSQALHVYLETAPEAILDHPVSPSSVSDFLFSLMDSICHARAADPLRRGCLVCNSVNELVGSESPIKVEILDVMAARQLHVEQLISRAVRMGELPEATNIELTAKMFMNFIFGLNTFSKTAENESELRDLCEAFLKSMGFYRRAEISQQAG
ncbi:TetR/AcrR family transcriptional regulator [Halioxenophilus aromaticivorans]|uniref:TetR/AcrR family transcriptional regulator n=1 Tax=Halioxenophilus aromaticivorans TaxID=1306992 RepID=A0AAV3U4Y6_9ALTE